MCRLLCVTNPNGLDPHPHLDKFAELSKTSQEYQGHGWGCAWLDENNSWLNYHNLLPIWEDPKRNFPNTRAFLAHARSAFRDEGICIENNMPFGDDRFAFIFNGELQGVRIKESGRIGAEKIFNYIKRFDHGDTGEAIIKATAIIGKRSHYIRAMNFVLADPKQVHCFSLFNEKPDYFQMRSTTSDNTHIICSQSYPFESNWQLVPNNSYQSITIG